MHPLDVDQEAEFARTLAAYDDALAGGSSWPPLDVVIGRLDPKFTARLNAAKKLLKALEQVWPRSSFHRSSHQE